LTHVDRREGSFATRQKIEKRQGWRSDKTLKRKQALTYRRIAEETLTGTMTTRDHEGLLMVLSSVLKISPPATPVTAKVQHAGT